MKRGFVIFLLCWYVITSLLSIGYGISHYDRLAGALTVISANGAVVVDDVNDFTIFAKIFDYVMLDTYKTSLADDPSGGPNDDVANAEYVLLLRKVQNEEHYNPDTGEGYIIYGINLSISRNDGGLDPVIYESYWYSSESVRDTSFKTLRRMVDLPWTNITDIDSMSVWGAIVFLCNFVVTVVLLVVNFVFDVLILALVIINALLVFFGFLPPPSVATL